MSISLDLFWDKLPPRFDLGRVRALDVGQWAVVEFLLQSLREQDCQIGVVDELYDVSRRVDRLLWTHTGMPKSTAARREA